VLAPVAAVVVLAACGSSTSKTSTSAGAAPSSAAVVQVSHRATAGSVLADANGHTLYTLTKDGRPVACTAACASIWPPLLLPAGTTRATGSTDVTGLGTVSVAGGTQVTENGEPLYRYSGDMAPGDTNGEGINSFGGVWHVVAPTSASASGATPALPSTTTAGGNGGYGGYGG
jgi:predicted lipoprotein with Yx(FWY)xxD motif